MNGARFVGVNVAIERNHRANRLALKSQRRMEADNAAGYFVREFSTASNEILFCDSVARILRCIPQFKGNSRPLLLIVAIGYGLRWGQTSVPRSPGKFILRATRPAAMIAAKFDALVTNRDT